MTEERKISIYQNANALRRHQDNLRWTLLGGYSTFFVATVALLTREQINDEFLKPLLLILFIVGNLFVLILAVENWYYNLYVEYVKDCESKLILADQLVTLAEFTYNNRCRISPYHFSFFFALTIGIVGNSYCAYVYMDKLGCESFFITSVILTYASIWVILIWTWQFTVYSIILRSLRWIFTLLHRKSSGKKSAQQSES